MGMNDIGCYLHLTLVKAAKELDMSTTALKCLCRKCGLAGWPSRQVLTLQLPFFYTVGMYMCIITYCNT